MKTKTVSQLDALGNFIGATLADESPLEPGVWLLPAGAVDAAPPDVPEGRSVRWTGQDFVLVPLPEPEPLPEPQPPTEAELIAAYDAALEAHFDAVAAQRNYNSRNTAALRAGYAGPFQAEGLAFALWMDNCNVQALQTLADVRAELRPAPTIEEFIAELPAIVWPASPFYPE